MIVAIITARGGSKGLPRKNILPLMGKPLISWTIEAALKSKYIDATYVSTEDNEIANISSKFGAHVIERPPELAEDNTSSELVILHAIEWLIKQNTKPSIIVLLQPTSPLRNEIHIDEAIELYLKNRAQCVISVFEPAHTPIKAYVECEGGFISGLYSLDAPYMRRQDLPRAFQPNGAIYLFDRINFMKERMIPRKNVYPYIMSERESADIDTKDDMLRIELILREKNDKSSI